MSTELLYQGEIVRITHSPVASDTEASYQLRHSLVVSTNPASIGSMDTYTVYGAQYSHNMPYSPSLSATSIVRSVITEGSFRPSLISYIQKYVSSSESAIFRAIGMSQNDLEVEEHLSQLPKRSISQFRSSNRVNIIESVLEKIPHIPITDYLDYGTGDGTIAAAVKRALGIPNVQGVDVYPVERPIHTLVVKDKDRLPKEWDNRFQLVTSFSVLHHVKFQKNAIDDLYRVMKPGGLLVVREHDYINMTPPNDLLGLKTHKQVLETNITNVFRKFLDAIHIVAIPISDRNKEFTPVDRPFWALYRSRYNWQSMLESAGFVHMCTITNGISPYTAKGDLSWISKNPQRIYESVYMKPGAQSSLILREPSAKPLSTMFPKIGDSLPELKKGIHYTESSLRSMIPWFQARSISVTLSNVVQKEYNKKVFDIHDTSGNIGTLISLGTNTNISVINSYQPDPELFKISANLMELYRGTVPMPTKDGVLFVSDSRRLYVHKSDVTLDSLRNVRDNVVFVYPKWMKEGCSYRTGGYTFLGMSLEKFCTRMIETGASLISILLPTDYRLGIPHDSVPVLKDRVFVVLPRHIRKSRVQSVILSKPSVIPVRPTTRVIAKAKIPTTFYELEQFIASKGIPIDIDPFAAFDPQVLEELRMKVEQLLK